MICGERDWDVSESSGDMTRMLVIRGTSTSQSVIWISGIGAEISMVGTGAETVMSGTGDSDILIVGDGFGRPFTFVGFIGFKTGLKFRVSEKVSCVNTSECQRDCRFFENLRFLNEHFVEYFGEYI